ncbi:putative reverse transcriptase domain-containing protein [Tanacetum coccineum]
MSVVLPDNVYGNVKSSKPKTLDETIELANDLMDQKLRTYAEKYDNKRSTGNTNVANTQKGNEAAPKGNTEFYAVGNAKKRGNASGNPESNVITGTFLLNNHYASILFDTGAYRSFISTSFSCLIDIVPTPLDNSYDVKLADGKIVGIDTIIQGCTLNFLDDPFNIDLMPVELGSFDVIIGKDWLRRCHAVIVCDEKLVQVTYGNKTLTFYGNESNNGRESRLTVISYSKAQEYMAKGCQDVPIVQDFPEVFPADLPGLPPARLVEFQIDLIPGAAPVARAPGGGRGRGLAIENPRDCDPSKSIYVQRDGNKAPIKPQGTPAERVITDDHTQTLQKLEEGGGTGQTSVVDALNRSSEVTRFLVNEDVGGMIRKDIPKKVGTTRQWNSMFARQELVTLLWRLKIRDYARIHRVKYSIFTGSDKRFTRT